MPPFLPHLRTVSPNAHSEPGYYEDGAFGIRIENVLVVEKAEPACKYGGGVWLRFAPLTCVPISTRAVDVAQLSAKEVAWVNDYNAWCRTTLEPLLQGEPLALAWLGRECAPIG
jgi:Xaa-Pro aminopeptidase